MHTHEKQMEEIQTDQVKIRDCEDWTGKIVCRANENGREKERIVFYPSKI